MKSPLAARFSRRTRCLLCTRWSGVTALAGLSMSVAPAVLAQEPVTTYTNGAGTAVFSNSANFTAAPTTYGILAFGTATTGFTVNNDLTGLNQNEILFNSANAYILSGNAITLQDYGANAGKIENNSGSASATGLATVNFGISFTATAGPTRAEINAITGNITFGSTGTIAITGSQVAGLQLYGNAAGTNGKTVTFGGVISGTGKYLEINGGNTAIFNAVNTYTGDTYIYNGSTLQLGLAASAVGSIATASTIRLGGDNGSGITNAAGSATLTLATTAGGQTVANPLNAVSGNANTLLLLSANTSNTNTYSGNIFLDNNMTVQSTSGGTFALTGGTIDLKNQLLTINSGGTTNFTGVLQNSTGSGSLTKLGSGTTTLSGTNTYTGATTISAGILQLGNGGTTGSLSTSSAIGSIASNSFLAINRSNAVAQGTDFSGAALTGAGGFTQNGAGTTTLNAVNTYSGATTINNGILRVAGGTAIADNSAVVFGTGNFTILDLNGTNEAVGSLAGGGSQSTVLLGANTLGIGGDNSSPSYAGVIFGTGGLAKTGTGTQTLNTTGTSTNTAVTGNLFSGGITVAAGGGLTISGFNTSGTGLITTSGTLNISQPQLLLTGGITINAGTTTLSTANTGGLGTITLNGGTLAVTGSTAAQLASVVLNSGTFALTNAVVFGSLAGTQGFTQTANAITLGTNNTSGTYSGIIGGAVASNLTKTGSGTQVLNGTDATTGTITANGSGGTLEIGGQFNASGAVAVNAGTLRLNFGTNNSTTANLIGAGALTLGGGTLAVTGQTGATNVSQSFASTAFTAGSASNVSITNGGGSTVLNFAGLSRGAGSAVNFILPSGTQSTTNGITTTTGGTSNLLRASNVAYATVGGTDFAAKDAGSNIVALTTSVNATSTSLGASGNDSNVTGQDTTTGAATINTIRFNDSAAARTLTLTGALNINSGGILVSSGVTAAGSKITGGTITTGTTGADLVVHQFSSQAFTLDSAIVNNGVTGINLTKSGPGTLILTQANTTSGATYVDSGILRIGAGGSLASSTVNLSPNDPTAVFDLNNQTTSVSGLAGGGTTGGYVTLGTRGTLNITGNGGTFSGTLVGGVDSVVNKTASGTQGFQASNLAFLGTINLTGASSGLGVFNTSAGNLSNATVNLTNATSTLTSGGGFITAYALGNLNGAGSIDGGTVSAQNETVGVGYLGVNGSFSGVVKNGTGSPTPGVVSFVKYGSGTQTLSGTNTYTGTTQLNSGSVNFDYSTGNTPLPTTGALTIGGGKATFNGASAGTAISTGTFGVNNSVLSQVAITGGSGTTLTLKTATVNSIVTLGSNTANNVLLFDTSATGVVLKTDAIVGIADSTAAGTSAIRTQNGLLVTGAGASTATFNNYRADVLIKDSPTTIGFATNNGTTTISRYTGATALPAASTATLDTTNYIISNSTVTRTAAVLYNTLQLDSSTAPAALSANFDTFTRFGAGSASVSGRGVLATGSNGASISSGGGTNQPTYFYNYQTGSTAGQTLTLNMPLAGQTVFNGTGLTVATGLVNASDQYFQSGVTRLTGAQSSGDSLTAGQGVYRLVGGVLEIGADLTGTTSATAAADFSRSVGTAAGQVQLLGDTGFSAFGGNRTVNLGGAGRTVVWGNDNFLASPAGNLGGTTEGNNTFRLSSPFSDSTIDFQNGIALGSLTRNVDVANGSAAVDARLSGVLSGVVDLTSTLANAAPATTQAAAGLNKLGAGTLELTAANTFKGQTTVVAGALQLGNALALQNSTLVPLTGGVIFSSAVAGNAFTVGGLSGTTTGPTGTDLVLANNASTAIALTIGNNNTSPTYAGVLSGTGSLTKIGTGTQTLTGSNTYNGTTTVNAGTLLVNGNQTSATGAVTVNNSGTLLGGTGTIGGAVTVNGPSAITGATAGTVGTLTLLNGLAFVGTSGNLANFMVDLSGATADKLAITGNLDLSTAFDKLTLNLLAAPTQQTYQLLTYTGSLTGTFDDVSSLPSGYSLSYATAGEVDLITPVPEPGTVAAGLLAFGSLGLSQRRRVRRFLSAKRLMAKAA